jgi:hypothetical protein
MANRKISDLTALTAPATGDLLPIVDISEAAAADKNKKITYGELLASAPAGSAAAPSFSFDGDPNTGIYNPGADTLAFVEGGVESMRIDSSGRVGIKTSSPGTTLDVVGNSRFAFGTGATNTGDQNVIIAGLATTGAHVSSYGAALQFEITNSTGGYAGARILSRLNADNNTANLVFQARNYGFTDSMTLRSTGIVNIANTPTYADNAAATSGGLVAGDIYRKSDGTLMIRY